MKPSTFVHCTSSKGTMEVFINAISIHICITNSNNTYINNKNKKCKKIVY